MTECVARPVHRSGVREARLDREPRQLAQLVLLISESQARELERDDAGIYFDWGPDQQAYHAHVEIRTPRPLPPWLVEAAN